MNKEVWTAWLAGLIEGEGTINLSRSNRKTLRHPYFRSCLHIANTNRMLLEKAKQIIAEISGAKATIVIANKIRPANHKIGWRLAVQAQRDLIKLLPLLIPYLVGKGEQAHLLLDFCKRRTQRCNARWYEFAEIDQAIYWQMRKLNRRGTGTVESIGESPASAGEDVLRATEESVEVGRNDQPAYTQ